MHRLTKPLTIAIVSAVLVIGVGMATYFLGSDRDTGSEGSSGYVELDVSTVKGFSGAAEEVLRLPWGSGPADASRKGERVRVSTIEAVFGSEGYTFVVDHPKDVVGARVRWFSARGELVGEYLAPAGSTNFRPQDGGFNYIIAKAGRPSETAALVDVVRSTETTYVVPLRMNSGGLFWSGRTLWASIAHSEVDFKAETVTLTWGLIPVAVDGVQVEDPAADEGASWIWGYGMDDKPYTFTTGSDAINYSAGQITTLIGSGSAKIRIPAHYQLLGVTPGSQICLGTVREAPSPDRRPVQGSAVWTQSREPFDEVLVIGMDAKVKSNIVFPYSSSLVRYDGTLPMSVCDDGLYTIRADAGGVTVVAYRLK